MIHIRANKLALILFVVGGLIALIGTVILKLPDPIVISAIGITVIAIDLIVRLRARGQAGWLTRREFGGTLFMIPMWVIGIVAIVGGTTKR